MTEPVEILRYARDVVLSDESKWARGGTYRSRHHNSHIVGYAEVADAERFCVLGAVARARYELGAHLPPRLLYMWVPEGLLLDACLGARKSAWTWNDESGRTFSDVIDLFDRAIKKCEEA